MSHLQVTALRARSLNRSGKSGYDALYSGTARWPRRIDVHHHVSPPTWLEAVKKAKLDFPPAVNWSAEKSIADMDAGGVATSIVSPTMPHVGFLGAADAARVARDSNEYVKRLMADHPRRFGMFAILPMPHVDESLK